MNVDVYEYLLEVYEYVFLLVDNSRMVPISVITADC